jgi:hypothetical protein
VRVTDTSRTNLAAALGLLSRWRLSKPAKGFDQLFASCAAGLIGCDASGGRKVWFLFVRCVLMPRDGGRRWRAARRSACGWTLCT